MSSILCSRSMLLKDNGQTTEPKEKKKTSGWERKKDKIASKSRKIDSFFPNKSTTASKENASLVELTSGTSFLRSCSYRN